MLPEVSQWVKMAQTDLRVVRHLFDTCYPMPNEVICYHCQQSAEKAIQMASEILVWVKEKLN